MGRVDIFDCGSLAIAAGGQAASCTCVVNVGGRTEAVAATTSCGKSAAAVVRRQRPHRVWTGESETVAVSRAGLADTGGGPRHGCGWDRASVDRPSCVWSAARQAAVCSALYQPMDLRSTAAPQRINDHATVPAGCPKRTVKLNEMLAGPPLLRPTCCSCCCCWMESRLGVEQRAQLRALHCFATLPLSSSSFRHPVLGSRRDTRCEIDTRGSHTTPASHATAQRNDKRCCNHRADVLMTRLVVAAHRRLS